MLGYNLFLWGITPVLYIGKLCKFSSNYHKLLNLYISSFDPEENHFHFVAQHFLVKTFQSPSYNHRFLRIPPVWILLELGYSIPVKWPKFTFPFVLRAMFPFISKPGFYRSLCLGPSFPVQLHPIGKFLFLDFVRSTFISINAVISSSELYSSQKTMVCQNAGFHRITYIRGAIFGSRCI